MNGLLFACQEFLRDEEGVEVIEYALILSVIVIMMVLSLRDLDGNYGTFLQRVADCIAGNCT